MKRALLLMCLVGCAKAQPTETTVQESPLAALTVEQLKERGKSMGTELQENCRRHDNSSSETDKKMFRNMALLQLREMLAILDELEKRPGSDRADIKYKRDMIHVLKRRLEDANLQALHKR